MAPSQELDLKTWNGQKLSSILGGAQMGSLNQDSFLMSMPCEVGNGVRVFEVSTASSLCQVPCLTWEVTSGCWDSRKWSEAQVLL